MTADTVRSVGYCACGHRDSHDEGTGPVLARKWHNGAYQTVTKAPARLPGSCSYVSVLGEPCECGTYRPPVTTRP